MKEEFYLIYEKSKIRVSRIINNISRPTIVFLHDSFGCIKLWVDFPDIIGKKTNSNVLIYDRIGYGQSSDFESIERDINYLDKEAEILKFVLDEMKLEKSVLFGHSDGGTIALIAASKYPEMFYGIITEGAHIFVEDISRKGIEESIKLYKNSNLKEKLEKYHGDKTENVFHAWADTWLSDNFRIWNIEHLLKYIKCPTHVIQGENDEYGSIKQVEGIAKGIVESEVKTYIIKDAKHTPHKEAKETIINIVSDIVNNITNN